MIHIGVTHRSFRKRPTLKLYNASAFYEHLRAEAYALADRFELIYTPKSASWLNMVECAFRAVPRQCLNRRIATIEKLRAEMLTLLEKRCRKQIKISWQFSRQPACPRLNTHRTRIYLYNDKYKETYLTH